MPLQLPFIKLLGCFITTLVLYTATYSQEILLHYDSTYHINFGKTLPVQFEVITANGEHLWSKTIVDGNIPWRKFDIKVTGGRFKDGEIIIGNYKEVIDEHLVKLEVEYKPLNLRRDFFIPLRFNGECLADYKPKTRGARHKFRLVRININGADGLTGLDAPDLVVDFSMKLIRNDSILIASIVETNEDDTLKYFINPEIGRLKIIAEGGNGGDGEEPREYGRQGRGGIGGKGADITVLCEEQIKPLLKSVEFHIGPGKTGTGTLKPGEETKLKIERNKRFGSVIFLNK